MFKVSLYKGIETQIAYLKQLEIPKSAYKKNSIFTENRDPCHHCQGDSGAGLIRWARTRTKRKGKKVFLKGSRAYLFGGNNHHIVFIYLNQACE